MMKTKDLRMEEPFESLSSAPTESAVRTQTRISRHIELHGLEDFQPIVVWSGRNLVIHGFEWVRGALQHRIQEVPVIERHFENEEQAIEYLLRLRRNREDWTDADIFIWVEHYEGRGPRGRPPNNVLCETISLPEKIRIAKDESVARFNPDDPPEKFVRDIRRAFSLFHIAKFQREYKRTSERLADKLNLKHRNKIDKSWYIIDHGDETIKDQVRRGWMGIHEAYTKLRNLQKGHNFLNVNFQGLVLQIPAKLVSEIDVESLKWIILGSGDPPEVLPKGSKIYHRGKDSVSEESAA